MPSSRFPLDAWATARARVVLWWSASTAFTGMTSNYYLLLQALQGFRRACLPGAVLEVTAENAAAVRIYRRFGFRCRKTVYKAVETQVFALVADEAVPG